MALTPEQERALLNARKRLALKKAQERLSAKKDDTFMDIRPEFLESRARMAPATFPALAAAAGETYITDPIEAVWGEEQTTPMFSGERFKENLAKRMQQAAEITGADLSLQPQNIQERFTGGAISAALDPVSYGGAPFKLLHLSGRAGGQAALGGTSEVTGELGAQMEQQLTGEDTGTGRLIGGLTPVAGAVPATAVVRGTATSVMDTSKQFFKGRSAKAGIPAEQRGILKDIAEEQGLENVDNILEEFNRIGQKIDNTDIPLLVAMSDNPVVAQQMGHLVKTDMVFRQRVNTELMKLTDAIENYSARTFGGRYPNIGKPSEVVRQMQRDLNPVRKRIEGLNDQIDRLSERLTPTTTSTERGQQIANLVEQRKKAVRSEMSPKYDALMKDADAAGAMLPSSATENIYQFIKQNKLRDLFGKGTPLDRKIMTHLAPRKREVPVQPQLTDEQRLAGIVPTPTTKSVNTYPEVSFRNVDSLKRAINELKRKPLSESEMRKVMQLDEMFKNARTEIPGDFNQRLIDIDMEYYEKIGIPFSKQGIVDIGAKKYYEEVAPQILKNRSALSNFLEVSGEEGVDIARNSVIADVYSKVVKDGSVSNKALSKYLKDKAEIIAQIPGLRGELAEIGIDQGKLMLAKDTLERAYKTEQTRIGKHFLAQSSDIAGVDYTKLVRGAFTNKKSLDSLYQDIGRLDPNTANAVKRALRSELIDFANTQPMGAYAFLTDVKNRAVVGRVMGPGYQQAALDVARLADAVRKANVSQIHAKLEKDAVGKIAGVDTPYIASQVRDRISSIPQRIIRLASKAWDSTRGDRFDESMKELFMEPESLAKLKKVADAQKKYGVTGQQAFDRFIVEGVRTLGEVMPAYVYTGFKPMITEQGVAP